MAARADALGRKDQSATTHERGRDYTLFSRRHTAEQRSKHVRTEVSSQAPDYEKIAEIVYGRTKPKTSPR